MNKQLREQVLTARSMAYITGVDTKRLLNIMSHDCCVKTNLAHNVFTQIDLFYKLVEIKYFTFILKSEVKYVNIRMLSG